MISPSAFYLRELPASAGQLGRVFNFNHEPFSGRPVSKLRPPTLLLDGRFFWLRFPCAFDCVSPRAASAPRLSPILHLSSKEEDHSQNRKGRKRAKKRLKGGEKKKIL